MAIFGERANRSIRAGWWRLALGHSADDGPAAKNGSLVRARRDSLSFLQAACPVQ
jgi:hypothetical protein